MPKVSHYDTVYILRCKHRPNEIFAYKHIQAIRYVKN